MYCFRLGKSRYCLSQMRPTSAWTASTRGKQKCEFSRRIPGPVEHVVVDDRHHVSHFWCMFYIEHQVRPNKSFLVMIREKDEVLNVIV